MVRTQIYLTEAEHSAIAQIARKTGQGKSEMIRQAVDEFIARRDGKGRLERLRAARGIWKGRKDIPDLRETRAAFDRF